MANSATHAALPYPVKGARYTVQVPYLDADGDPTDPTTPDTEISKDGAAYADCAEEVTTITGSNGSGYITLSGAEMDCSMAMLAAKVASGPKATLATLHPRVLPVLYSGTAGAGAAGTLTLASDVPAIANLLIGCILKTTGGTGGGGTGGANNQARVITGYTTGRVATVTPNWETTPDATTTYEVLLTEAALIRMADIYAISGDTAAADNLETAADGGSYNLGGGGVVAASVAGNVGGNVTGSVGSVSTGGITAASIADGAIDRATFAADTGLQSVRSNTAQAGGATSITLDASASATTDFYKHCLIYLTGGTGVGQYRICTAYNGTTKVATITPAWATNPDSTSTFAVLPAGLVNLEAIAGAAVSTSSAQLGVNVVNAAGTAWASGAITAAVIADNAIDAGAIAADAITAAKIADGAIDANTFAVGAITASAIAADAIGASELAADAVAEIADAIWDEAASGHVTSGTFGQALNIVRAGTAQAGASTTITLDASASAVDDFYNNDIIFITGGTGVGQSRIISDYVGSTKVATVSAWATNPSSDSVFVILPFGAIPGATAPTAAEVADAVWDEARSGHVSAGSFGEYVLADAVRVSGDATAADNLEAVLDGTGGVTLVASAFTLTTPITANATQISGDATAADNAEAFFDGTGYAGTNNVIPTVTTVTNQVAADVTAISGDSSAADNAEKFFDGTGYGAILQRTTIATLASQTSFTLTAGSADNDAYNGCEIVIEDASTAAQKAVGVVDDYTGATKTVTLRTDPAVFTMAAGDVVTILASRSLKSTVDNRSLDVTATGAAGVDWANVEGPTTTLNLSGTTVKTATDVETDTADIQSRLPAALGANGNIKADVRDYSGTAGTFSGGRPEVNASHAAGTAWNSGAIGASTLASDTITAAKIAADAITAAKIATGAIDADALAADAVSEIWTTALTEAYRGAGATGTAAQLLYEIIAHLGESAISGTTKTLKKLDGSTTAKTYTLDSATTPTSITETT